MQPNPALEAEESDPWGVGFHRMRVNSDARVLQGTNGPKETSIDPCSNTSTNSNTD